MRGADRRGRRSLVPNSLRSCASGTGRVLFFALAFPEEIDTGRSIDIALGLGRPSCPRVEPTQTSATPFSIASRTSPLT